MTRTNERHSGCCSWQGFCDADRRDGKPDQGGLAQRVVPTFGALLPVSTKPRI
jgi:hypothetical protein